MKRRTFVVLASALLLAATTAFAKKKEKSILPELVLRAQTIFVVIQQDAPEPLNDPLANRRAQEEVEKAIMRWGRFRFAADASTADLIITIRKGTGKIANPTMSGGPIDSRPVTLETTDNQIRVGGQKGRPPDATQTTAAPVQDDRVHTGVAAGGSDDLFRVFEGGVDHPLDSPAVWTYAGKNALRPPDIPAVEQFHKAIDESEKASQKKQKAPTPTQTKTP